MNPYKVASYESCVESEDSIATYLQLDASSMVDDYVVFLAFDLQTKIKIYCSIYAPDDN